jgi:hypothetical protein
LVSRAWESPAFPKPGDDRRQVRRDLRMKLRPPLRVSSHYGSPLPTERLRDVYHPLATTIRSIRGTVKAIGGTREGMTRPIEGRWEGATEPIRGDRQDSIGGRYRGTMEAIAGARGGSMSKMSGAGAELCEMSLRRGPDGSKIARV